MSDNSNTNIDDGRDITIEQIKESTKEKLRKLRLHHFFRGSVFIWLAVIVLMSISLVAIFSSTTSLIYKHDFDNQYHYLFNRLGHIGLALAFMYVVHLVDVNRYRPLVLFAFVGSCALLIITYMMGDTVNGAIRSIGPIHPADLIKITLIMLIAQRLERYRKVMGRLTLLPWNYIMYRLFPNKRVSQRMAIARAAKANNEWYLWKRCSLHILWPIAAAFCIIFPSNLSTAMVVAFIAMALLVVGGVKFKEIMKLAAVALVSVFLFVAVTGAFRANTWKSRIENFVSGDSEQAIDARAAIAHGWLPQGPGGSIQRAKLPRAESDFMFAFLVEEYSILIVGVLFFIYLGIMKTAIHIASRLDNRFEAITCIGIALFITFQALVHSLVNVGYLPVTGLVLPFLSHGGSGLVTMSIAVGLLLNISTHAKKKGVLKNQ